MHSSPNEEIEALFGAVLECPAAARARFLDRACRGQPALREELLELLDAHRQATGFFAELAGDIAAAGALELESAVRPRVRIGPYRTRQIIGMGGMGVVYRAVRVDGEFEQQVALKLVHLDMETPEIRARFLAERQLLARLTHPNIARLQDGGVTEEGRPYFVMEYVEGLPITRYCVERKLSVEASLGLFLDVIEAVSYLHRNLIVHRDLKPSNILVAADGQVKLVDFGIAKLLADTPEAAGRTRTGSQLMTPGYAAPEQLQGAPVTTATDVYALGVVIYEVLTGERPHERSEMEAGASLEQLPPAPSAVVRSRRDAAERAGGRLLAWRRIAGDLDNICLMALRPEPERRYASAEQLGQDIERHLRGAPVLARRNTLAYRLAKFVRRHVRGVVVALGIVALLAVGLARERGLRGVAEGARAQAQEEAAKAVAVSDFLEELLSSVAPEKAQGEEVTVAEVLDQAGARLEAGEALRDQPAVEAAVRLTLGDTYRALGRLGAAETHLERAFELRRQSLDENDPETLEVVEALGVTYLRQGRLGEAEALLERVFELRSRRLGEEHPDTLTAMSQLANVLWGQGRFDEVEPLDRKAVEVRRRVLGEDHPDTLRSLNGLAATLFSGARYAEAADMFRQALAVQDRQLGPTHPDTLMLRNNLAACYLELGRYPEAEPLLREVLEGRVRVLGEEHGETAMSMHNLALTLAKRASYEEAESLLLRAIGVRGRLAGEKKTALFFSRSYLADIYRDQERYDEAEELYLSTLEDQRRNKGPEDAESLKTESGLAELRLRQGDVTAAETRITRVLEAQTRVVGDQHPDVWESLTTLAGVRTAQQRFAEAQELAERAIDLGSGTLGADHPLVLSAALQKVRALRGQDRRLEAVELASSVYAGRASRLGEEHPDTLAVLELVIGLHEAVGDPREAARYRALLPADAP